MEADGLALDVLAILSTCPEHQVFIVELIVLQYSKFVTLNALSSFSLRQVLEHVKSVANRHACLRLEVPLVGEAVDSWWPWRRDAALWEFLAFD